MDNSMDSIQNPVPLPSNEDQVHGNGNNIAFENPQLVESIQDHQSLSESIHQTSPKCLEEAVSGGSKMQTCTDGLQNDNTEQNLKPTESRVKSKTKKIFITEKGDILHESEAMEHIQASRKSEANTQASKDSKDIFISPDGQIQLGEDAIIAKALHDIEKSGSKPSRSFTVTLKHPKVEETEQHDDEANKDTESSVESSQKLSGENKDTHQEDFRDDSQQIEHSSGDEGRNEQENNTASYAQSFEGGDGSGNELSVANEIDQKACIQVEIDCNSSEDGYDSECSDYHRELEQSMSGTSIAVEINIVTQSDDNEEFSDTEEDGHRLLQQHHSSVTFKVNEHTKSKISSSKEVFEAKKTIASSEVKAATTDSKGINEKVQCLASETNVKGGEVCVATAETKLIDTQVKAGTVATKVKGAEVKVATSDMKGLRAQAGASVNISTKGSTTTAGRVELKGADVDIEATAEPTAQGASIQTGTATVTGVQEKIKADVKATISGTKVQAGVADISAVKFGATAEASVEAAGLDVKVGTAQVSAIEASATASASASTEAKVSIGSARVTGFDGIGASASVTRSQTEIFSAQVGISGHTGIQVSNATKVGCISLAPGPPKLGFGKSILSFGFGGLDGGQSGTYAAVATVGNPEGSSRHGNSGCGGNAGNGDFSSYDSGPGSGIEGNTSEMSPAQGSSGLAGGIQGHSGTCASNTSVDTFEVSHNECGHNSNGLLNDKNVLGNSTERNTPETVSAQVSLDVPSVPLSGSVSGGSTTIGVNSIFCSGTSHNHQSQDHTMVQDIPESHDKIEDKHAKTGSSESVKFNEQPFHLRVLQTLEYEHFRDDKKDNASLSNKQTAVLTNTSRQQLSAAKCDSQLRGTEAKLQTEINQLYPTLCGSGKPEVNKTVEQIKHATIRKLNSEGKAGAHTPESSSTMSTNDSTDNLPRKKAKPFGSRNHIHTLDSISMESPKQIVDRGNYFGFDD